MIFSPPQPQNVNGWFSRLNGLGEVVSGAGTIVYGETTLTNGHEPQWLTDDLIAFKATSDDGKDRLYAIHKLGQGEPPALLRHEPMQFFAAGAGAWYVPNRAAGEIGAAIDPVSGTTYVLLEHDNRNDDRSIVMANVAELARGPIENIRVFNGFVLWSDAQHGIQGFLDGGRKDLHVLDPSKAWESKPVPILTDTGWWELFQTNIDLRLRPIGSLMGYIIATGEDMNFHPDARGFGDRIRVVWNDKHGLRYQIDIPLSTPRTNVKTASPVVIDPPPPPKPEDPPVSLPDPHAVLRVLERERAKYPAKFKTVAEMNVALGAVLNNTAREFPGMGMHFKTGEKAASYPGVPVTFSRDTLRVYDLTQPDDKLGYWSDVLEATGALLAKPYAPEWKRSNDDIRTFVEPVGAAPTPEPEPEPEPETEPSDIEARMARVEAWFRRAGVPL
jgi:hypothetical protein